MWSSCTTLYASQAEEDAKDAHDKWLWDQTWREDTARAQGLVDGRRETGELRDLTDRQPSS